MGDLKQEILRLKQSLEKSNKQIDELKEEVSNVASAKSNMVVDENGNVDLYPGSTIQVQCIRQQACLRNSITLTSFVSQIFTSLTTVEKCVGRNLKGGKSKIDKTAKKKKKFSIKILHELYKAVFYHFEKEISVSKINYFNSIKNANDKKFKKIIYGEINKVVNKKLGAIQRHFKNLNNNVKDNELSED